MIQEKISDVRGSYDLVAEEYARQIYDELQHKPLDRQLLTRFADSVRGAGLTCDLGCGPGHVARYLQSCGIEVCGVDLAPGMITMARKLNPGITFEQGDMLALPVKDAQWAGIVAPYSIVNLTPESLVRALGEMMRVLIPGGRLLVSFHIGEDNSEPEDMWNYGTALDFTFFRVVTVADSMRAAGFEVEEIVERGPYAPEIEYQSRRAYIFAQKPTKITSE